MIESCSIGAYKVTVSGKKYYYCPFCEKAFTKSFVANKNKHMESIHGHTPITVYCKLILFIFKNGENIHKFVVSEVEKLERVLREKQRTKRSVRKEITRNASIPEWPQEYRLSQPNSIVIQLIIYKWIKENDIESVIVQLNNEYGNVEEYIGRIRKEYDNKLLNVVDNSNISIDVDKFKTSKYKMTNIIQEDEQVRERVIVLDDEITNTEDVVLEDNDLEETDVEQLQKCFKDTLAGEKLNPILEVKRGKQLSFPSYNIKFEKVLKHLNFKE